MVAMMVMMMMMMAEVTAMPKGSQSRHSTKGHRKSSDDAAVETVPLQLDPSTLVPDRNIRPLENASISPWIYKYENTQFTAELLHSTFTFTFRTFRLTISVFVRAKRDNTSQSVQ